MTNFLEETGKNSGLVVEFRQNMLSRVELSEADKVMKLVADEGYQISGRDSAVLLLGGVHRVTDGSALLTFSGGRIDVWKTSN